MKSVLSAPVPAYCTEHASALSAQTKTNITKAKHSQKEGEQVELTHFTTCSNHIELAIWGFIKGQELSKLSGSEVDFVCVV